MLSRSINLALPRRVVVMTLLFGVGAVAWSVVSSLLAMQTMVLNSELDARITGARRLGLRVRATLLEDAPEKTHAVLQSIRSEGDYAYCAVVGNDGRYIAHTERGLRGKDHIEPMGEADERSGLDGTKYVRHGVPVFEYRLPMRDKERSLGSLRLAVATPTMGAMLQRCAGYLPLLAMAPFLFIVGSSFLVQKMLRPIDVLDRQVRKAVLAPTIADAEFEAIPQADATSAGWNQIVNWLTAADDQTGLGNRLTAAMTSIKQERSTDILNSLSDGIAVTDSEGRITLANSALSVLLTGETDSDSIQGKSLTDLLAVARHDPNSQLLNSRAETRIVSVELNRGTESDECILRVNRNPVRNADGSLANGHAWLIRDVTQQKLTEKMRDQFLDSATHELRTPLANIRAYAETLACMDEIDVESQKTFCNTINTEATRLARFIDDLLSISSMEVGSMALNRSNCDIERLLHEAVAKVAGHAEQKQIAIETVLPPKYPRMKLDKDKVQIALVNLLGNAVKYTPNGGSVTLRVRVYEEAMHIDIEDTGVGISAEELPQVFDKFFRSSSDNVQAVTGTGLGLSMTQEIVRLHSGELTVSSKLGEGSTFSVVLPLDRTS